MSLVYYHLNDPILPHYDLSKWSNNNLLFLDQRYESSLVQVQVQEIPVQFKLIPKHNF